MSDCITKFVAQGEVIVAELCLERVFVAGFALRMLDSTLRSGEESNSRLDDNVNVNVETIMLEEGQDKVEPEEDPEPENPMRLDDAPILSSDVSDTRRQVTSTVESKIELKKKKSTNATGSGLIIKAITRITNIIIITSKGLVA